MVGVPLLGLSAGYFWRNRVYYDIFVLDLGASKGKEMKGGR